MPFSFIAPKQVRAGLIPDKQDFVKSQSTVIPHCLANVEFEPNARYLIFTLNEKHPFRGICCYVYRVSLHFMSDRHRQHCSFFD